MRTITEDVEEAIKHLMTTGQAIGVDEQSVEIVKTN